MPRLQTGTDLSKGILVTMWYVVVCCSLYNTPFMNGWFWIFHPTSTALSWRCLFSGWIWVDPIKVLVLVRCGWVSENTTSHDETSFQLVSRCAVCKCLHQLPDECNISEVKRLSNVLLMEILQFTVINLCLWQNWAATASPQFCLGSILA